MTSSKGDFYTLHELAHLATMQHEEIQLPRDFLVWEEKMMTNERRVSTISDAFIHILHPSIRPLLPIPHIWADRFINQNTIDGRPIGSMEESELLWRVQYAFASIGKSSITDLDPEQLRTWAYHRTDRIWAYTYYNIAQAVEHHMVAYQRMVRISPEKAVTFHINWLKRKMKDGVPFQSNAHAYAQVLKSMPDLGLPGLDLSSKAVQQKLTECLAHFGQKCKNRKNNNDSAS